MSQRPPLPAACATIKCATHLRWPRFERSRVPAAPRGTATSHAFASRQPLTPSRNSTPLCAHPRDPPTAVYLAVLWCQKIPCPEHAILLFQLGRHTGRSACDTDLDP
eukprot:495310-Pleurochrysis_carterae.AAC.2